MGAAIWSTDAQNMQAFPARYFVRFFHNHGMLSVDQRPQWRVVRGGSARYVERLTAPFRDRIRLNTPVEWIRRLPGQVLVKARGRDAERFDQVFLACHSDQALALLADASAAGARSARRHPLPGERGRAAHRHPVAAAPRVPGRHGTTTCCRKRANAWR